MKFLIVNSEIIRKEDANLTHLFWNELFIISQKIWFGFGGIPLFDENIDFFCRQLEILNISIPDFLRNKRELFRISKRMLNKNMLFKSGYLHVQLYILDSKVNYTITGQASELAEFPFSETGSLVNVSDIKKDAVNLLNQYPFYNKTTWKVIKSKIQNTNYQNSILLNDRMMVCEGIATNIFMLKDGVLVTPSLESGCFEDSLRKPILETANQLNIKTLELHNIKKEHITEMDELFFASEQLGIEWILGIKNKRFVNLISKRIHKKLNEYLKGKVS